MTLEQFNKILAAQATGKSLNRGKASKWFIAALTNFQNNLCNMTKDYVYDLLLAAAESEEPDIYNGEKKSEDEIKHYPPTVVVTGIIRAKSGTIKSGIKLNDL